MKKEIIKIIDYIFEKIDECMDRNLKQIGETFGHELALALKNVLENKALMISGDIELTKT